MQLATDPRTWVVVRFAPSPFGRGPGWGPGTADLEKIYRALARYLRRVPSQFFNAFDSLKNS